MKGFKFLILCICIMQSTWLYAESKEPGVTAANFLKLGIGARPAGLGEAFCAVADDANAAYWNPAGLAQVKEFQLTAIHNNWFEDIQGGYLGYVQPSENGAVGVSMIYMDEGEMKEMTRDNKEVGTTFKAEDMAVTVSFAQVLKREFLVGANLKYINQKIADENGMGFAGDIGLIYKPTKCVNFGLSVQNIGTKIKFVNERFSLPLNLKTGIAYKNKWLTLALDVNKPIDNDPLVCLGVESKIGNILALRLGYRHQMKDQKLDLYKSSPIGLTGGFGLGFGNTYFLDYAYVPYGDLGDTHRISFLMKLAPVEEVPPAVVPPVVPEKVPVVIPEERVTPTIPKVKPEIKPEVKPEVKPTEIIPEKPVIPTKPLEEVVPPLPPTEAAPEAIVPQRQIIILVDEVAIWSGPGATYEKLTTVSKGTKLVLLDDSKKWYYKVLLPDGTVGWVCYVFVSK